jgi:hypothetical protein
VPFTRAARPATDFRATGHAPTPQPTLVLPVLDYVKLRAFPNEVQCAIQLEQFTADSEFTEKALAVRPQTSQDLIGAWAWRIFMAGFSALCTCGVAKKWDLYSLKKLEAMLRKWIGDAASNAANSAGIYDWRLELGEHQRDAQRREEYTAVQRNFLQPQGGSNSSRIEQHQVVPPCSEAKTSTALEAATNTAPTVEALRSGPEEQEIIIESTWEHVEISFLSDERVQIWDGAKTESRNYSELGFADRRNGKPNLAWVTLRALAESKGTIRESPTGDWSIVEKRIQDIRRVLRGHFKLSADPIPIVKGTGYVCQFKIGCAASYVT